MKRWALVWLGLGCAPKQIPLVVEDSGDTGTLEPSPSCLDGWTIERPDGAEEASVSITDEGLVLAVPASSKMADPTCDTEPCVSIKLWKGLLEDDFDVTLTAERFTDEASASFYVRWAETNAVWRIETFSIRSYLSDLSGTSEMFTAHGTRQFPIVWRIWRTDDEVGLSVTEAGEELVSVTDPKAGDHDLVLGVYLDGGDGDHEIVVSGIDVTGTMESVGFMGCEPGVWNGSPPDTGGEE